MKRNVKGIALAMGLMVFLTSLFGCRVQKPSEDEAKVNDERLKNIELEYYDHRAGTNTMIGGGSYDTVREIDDRWVIQSFYCEAAGEPMTVTTYAVLVDKLIAFDEFIREKDVVSLEQRGDSNNFVTDYSPWEYAICFKKASPDDERRSMFYLDEYKEYSDEDYALLEELDKKFEEMKGSVLGEETRENY